MRKLLVMAACLLSLYLPCSLAAQNIKIGDFPVNRITPGSFVLGDAHAYKPFPSQRKHTLSWQLGDVIMVVHKKGTKRYILINTRTGDKAKTKIVSL